METQQQSRAVTIRTPALKADKRTRIFKIEATRVGELSSMCCGDNQPTVIEAALIRQAARLSIIEDWAWDELTSVGRRFGINGEFVAPAEVFRRFSSEQRDCLRYLGVIHLKYHVVNA